MFECCFSCDDDVIRPFSQLSNEDLSDIVNFNNLFWHPSPGDLPDTLDIHRSIAARYLRERLQ